METAYNWYRYPRIHGMENGNRGGYYSTERDPSGRVWCKRGAKLEQAPGAPKIHGYCFQKAVPKNGFQYLVFELRFQKPVSEELTLSLVFKT